MVMASARKKLPVTPVMETRGRKTTTGVMVEPMSGSGDFFKRFAHGFAAMFAVVAMEDDVFDNDNGIVDDQADGRGEAAEGHEVEAFAEQPQRQDGDGDGDGNDEAGDERRGPVAQEEEEDDAGEDESDEDGIAHAGDGVADELRLIVKEIELYAGGKLFLQFGDFAAAASATATVLLVGWREMMSSTADLPLAVTVV